MSEALVYTAIAVNVFLSLAIILLNAAFLFLLRFRKIASKELDEASVMFKQAEKAAQFGRIPAIGMAVVSDALKMPLEDVIREYEKDSMERRTIVYSVIREDSMSKRFVNEFRAQFMLTGYDGEDEMLKT